MGQTDWKALSQFHYVERPASRSSRQVVEQLLDDSGKAGYFDVLCVTFSFLSGLPIEFYLSVGQIGHSLRIHTTSLPHA